MLITLETKPFAALETDVGIADVGFAFAEGLDLRAMKD